MEVAVQWIRTSWTKRSRDGEAATRRNATPTAFPLPALPRPFTHEVTLSENDDFHPGPRPTKASRTPASASPRPPNTCESSSWRPGPAPPVRNRRPPACRLAPGEWLRWQINYRFWGYHGWSYRQDTLNLNPPMIMLGSPVRSGRCAPAQRAAPAGCPPCHERRFRVIGPAMKGAFRSLNVPIAPFGTPGMSRTRLSGHGTPRSGLGQADPVAGKRAAGKIIGGSRLNVAYGPAPADLFLGTPTHHVDELAALF